LNRYGYWRLVTVWQIGSITETWLPELSATDQEDIPSWAEIQRSKVADRMHNASPPVASVKREWGPGWTWAQWMWPAMDVGNSETIVLGDGQVKIGNQCSLLLYVTVVYSRGVTERSSDVTTRVNDSGSANAGWSGPRNVCSMAPRQRLWFAADKLRHHSGPDLRNLAWICVFGWARNDGFRFCPCQECQLPPRRTSILSTFSLLMYASLPRR